MARKKHRKLFPMLATEANKTLDCSIGICDPICPYNCYQEPDYYAVSPQLSPWSSPQRIRAPSPSPSVSAVYQPSQNPSSSSNDAIAIITITGAVLVILLTGFFLVAKYVTESVNRERYRSERDGDDDDDDTVEEEFQDREQVDHPIWLIRTTGLQQSVINSITICNYKRGDGLIERTDCPVCLSEFEEDECLRLLPKCNHAFHVSCIDTWLRSHTNCPLCRAGIAISAVAPRFSVPVDVTPGGSGSRYDPDRAQAENRGESGRERDIDASGFKERLSSSNRESGNTDPYSNVRIEILEEIDGDGSETETNEQVRAPNEGDSIDSFSRTKTQIESVHFPGRSEENQSRDFTRQENRPIRDEAAGCSEENSGHNVKSLRSYNSTDAGEFSGEETEDAVSNQTDISNMSKTTGSSSVSCFNKNKSSVFPL